MNHQALKDRIALLKANIADIDELLGQDEALDAVVDVSSFAQPREASFRFEFNGPVTTTGLRAVLTMLTQKHNVDPGYVMVSTADYKAIKEDLSSLMHYIVILRIGNDHTGGNARIVANPELQRGTAIFGVLYAPPVPQAISMTIGDEH